MANLLARPEFFSVGTSFSFTETLRHDSIKSFLLHNLIKDFLKYFEGKGYLFRRFFFSDMKDYITAVTFTTYIFIDLKNSR